MPKHISESSVGTLIDQTIFSDDPHCVFLTAGASQVLDAEDYVDPVDAPPYYGVKSFIQGPYDVGGTFSISGFTGGEIGQVVRILKADSTSTVTLLHNDTGLHQHIILASGVNEQIGPNGVGGWTLCCYGDAQPWHWTAFNMPSCASGVVP